LTTAPVGGDITAGRSPHLPPLVSPGILNSAAAAALGELPRTGGGPSATYHLPPARAPLNIFGASVHCEPAASRVPPHVPRKLSAAVRCYAQTSECRLPCLGSRIWVLLSARNDMRTNKSKKGKIRPKSRFQMQITPSKHNK